MEKILLIIEPTTLHMPSLELACYLANLTKSKLTGIFLENLTENQKPVLETYIGTTSLHWEIDESDSDYILKRRLTAAGIAKFSTYCNSKNIRSAVRRDTDSPLTDMIEESRYADLIIIDPSISLKKNEATPTKFTTDLFIASECPVLVAPENFEETEEIIFAFDGHASSVFAIKQFTYLFPELSEKKVIVLGVNDEGKNLTREKAKLSEWLQAHYSSVGYEISDGNALDGLFDFNFKRHNTILVLGSYGRTALSRFFKHSTADTLVQLLHQPIFIAHGI